MDTSFHNKFEPRKGNGQPLLDGVGQHGSGRGNANGQNGNDSSKATDGSSNRQQGIGSSSKATSEAHANAPNIHEANARDHGPKGSFVRCSPIRLLLTCTSILSLEAITRATTTRKFVSM